MPLVIIAVLLHRFRLIASDLFLVVTFVAGLVACLAVIVSMMALARLWQSGDQGWGRALAGLLFGAVSLLPYAWYGSLIMAYPAVTDITTGDRSLMPLVFEPGTAAMPAPKMLSAAEMLVEFPNVETRTYPLGLVPAFGLVEALVAQNGWDIRMQRDPGEFGQINAQVVTLAGWREEVVLRVTGTMETSRVDMRSASLNALHDFGSNGLRIEEFLGALDDAVTTLLRDNPGANQPIEPAVETPVETDVPAAPVVP